MRTLTQHNQTSGLDDRSLLPRNGLERIAQNTCVIEPNARNGDGDRIGRTRGVPAPAHADLEHGNIHRGLGKHYKCGSRQQVKGRDGIGTLPRRHTTGIHSTPRLNSGRNGAGKRLIAHHAPINLHALGIAHQLWRRIQRGFEPLTTKNGSRKTRSRSLAIGTSNLNAIKVLVRTPQLIKHIDNRLKQRTSIPRNPPRISSQPNSLIKRKQLKRERHRIRPRTLRHKPKSPQHKKRPVSNNEPLPYKISAKHRFAAESRPQPSGPNTPDKDSNVTALGAARRFARYKFRTQRTALNVLSVLRRTVRSSEQSVGTRPPVRSTRSQQPEQSAPPGSP